MKRRTLGGAIVAMIMNQGKPLAQTPICDGPGMLAYIISTVIDILESGRAYAADFYDPASLKRTFCAESVDIQERTRANRHSRFAIISGLDRHQGLPPADAKALVQAEFRIVTEFNAAWTPISAAAILILSADSNSLHLDRLQAVTGGRLVKQPPQMPVHGRVFQIPTNPHGNETWLLVPQPGGSPVTANFELQPDGTLGTAGFSVVKSNG